jgi:hypothetical protein
MKKISLYLKPSQITELHALSKQTGIPVSELIRRAIAALLIKNATN